METTISSTVVEPSILTANTYFWSPSCGANGRRNNEQRHLGAVASFLQSLGFEVAVDGSRVTGALAELAVEFRYSESCHNVYKHLAITRNGKRSNVTSLRKLYAQ